MKLISFSTKDNPTKRLGLKTDKGIIDVAHSSTKHGIPAPTALDDVWHFGTEALGAIEAAAETFLDEGDIYFGPCVSNPEKIICIGLNYKKHAEEAGATLPDTCLLYTSPSPRDS